MELWRAQIVPLMIQSVAGESDNFVLDFLPLGDIRPLLTLCKFVLTWFKNNHGSVPRQTQSLLEVSDNFDVDDEIQRVCLLE